MTKEEKIVKIISIILQEINGYSKEDAVKAAPKHKGTPLWARIEKFL